MELNVLLRGQSNAFYLSQSPNWPSVATEIQKLLGFDGVTNTVSLLASSNDPFGKNTINGGTAFIGDWLTANGGNWRNGWTNNTLETGLLNYISALPANVKSSPTAVVWLHNEYDSTNPNLTTAEWTSAVTDEATQVRQALGQSAATTPYVFVNAIPYGSNEIDAINQDIKLGMEQLAALPPFHATIGAQADDLSMDFGQTGTYGGPHMDPADANLVDHRLAVSIAETFAQYALPGSAVATGQVDAYGPEVMTAQLQSGNRVLVTVATDKAGLSGTLNADASAGVGWSVIDKGTVLNATSAQVVDANHVLLGFGSQVPSDGAAALFYSYGYGRLATSDADPGKGSAIYDTQQMPIWAPATGVGLSTGVATGVFLEQNLTTGITATLQGFNSSIAGYQSEFAALPSDSVVVTAETPSAFLAAGTAVDAMIATSGNNILVSDVGSTLMVGGSGTDTFVADANGAPIWDVVGNFHGGDTFVLWGAQSAQAPTVSWFDTAGGAVLSVTGGGFAPAVTTFQGFTAHSAAALFSESTGNGGGLTYIALHNPG